MNPQTRVRFTPAKGFLIGLMRSKPSPVAQSAISRDFRVEGRSRGEECLVGCGMGECLIFERAPKTAGFEGLAARVGASIGGQRVVLAATVRTEDGASQHWRSHNTWFPVPVLTLSDRSSKPKRGFSRPGCPMLRQSPQVDSKRGSRLQSELRFLLIVGSSRALSQIGLAWI
ncbi:unnamed protein product [Cercospora beticola]|nr:unnamed protein product [Cercospora beticola]